MTRPLRRAPRRVLGFTLIELLVTVAIVGILAAIAIPAFIGYRRRSKTSEATNNLNSMFTAAASYYGVMRRPRGLNVITAKDCSVDRTIQVPVTYGPAKRKVDFRTNASFKDLGFTIADYIYYSYGINGGASMCDWGPNSTDVYTLFALGDLDGDTLSSVFNLAVGTDANNELYHARGIAITDENE